jgi:hypothetical protein
MRHPGPVMIAGRRDINLGFMLEATEWFAMQYPVSISLKFCPDDAFFLSSGPSCFRTLGCKGGKPLVFLFF